MSAACRFYHVADRRLDEIWEYSCTHWGEAQAEKYIEGLFSHLQKAANRAIPWNALPQRLVAPVGVSHGVYMTRYKKHSIFFRELSGGSLGILSILHNAMNIPVRLQEDLLLTERQEVTPPG